jgi:hypothetical protein
VCRPANGQTDGIKASLGNELEVFGFERNTPIALMRRIQGISKVNAPSQKPIVCKSVWFCRHRAALTRRDNY